MNNAFILLLSLPGVYALQEPNRKIDIKKLVFVF